MFSRKPQQRPRPQDAPTQESRRKGREVERDGTRSPSHRGLAAHVVTGTSALGYTGTWYLGSIHRRQLGMESMWMWGSYAIGLMASLVFLSFTLQSVTCLCPPADYRAPKRSPRKILHDLNREIQD